MNEELWLLHLEEKLKSQKDMEEYITQGINNTRWRGTKAGYVDLLRRGLKVTEIEVEGNNQAENWIQYEQDLGDALHSYGYRKNKRDSLSISFGSFILYSGKVIRILIIPKEMNGFSLRDRIHYLNDDMYEYLKSNSLVY